MNKILERQLKRAFGSLENIPQGIEKFLKMVSDTYDGNEEDRKMIERSMEISSAELEELNKKIRSESDTLKGKLAELERINKLMVDRELKMIELKKHITELEARKSDGS